MYLGGILLTAKEIEMIKNPKGEIYTMPVYQMTDDMKKKIIAK